MLNKLVLPIQKELNALEVSFPETLKQYCDYRPLCDVLNHATQAPGKWLRSILLIYFAKMLGTDTFVSDKRLMLAAQSVEAIHLASLIHDDIFDEASLRRNVSCVYQTYGLNTGILSGVYIYSLALQLMTQLDDIKIVENLSFTVSELCEGEYRQLHQRNVWDMSLDEYLKIVDQKTAALFSSACYMGAKLAGASERHLSAAIKYGKAFGILFQLIDDFKDFFETKRTLKKEPLQDLVVGDVSYPLLLARQKLSSQTWYILEQAAKQKDFQASRSILNESLSQEIFIEMQNVIKSYLNILSTLLDEFEESVFVENLRALNIFMLESIQK